MASLVTTKYRNAILLLFGYDEGCLFDFYRVKVSYCSFAQFSEPFYGLWKYAELWQIFC